MLKYDNYAITFQEIPDEVCLYITLTGCPIHCPECNSKWLWEDTGTELTLKELDRIIKENEGITCVVFGGGDNDIERLSELCRSIWCLYDKKIKTAWYSGSKNLNLNIVYHLDYYKIGPFDSKYGPLSNPMTNQRLYKVEITETNYIDHFKLIDITDKFWK